MKKRAVRNGILLMIMTMILPCLLLSMRVSAATKYVYSNYIDYKISKNSESFTLKMHKSTKGKVVWSSSNKKVAVISSTGKSSAKVSIKGAGTCTITAKVDGKTYSVKFTSSTNHKITVKKSKKTYGNYIDYKTKKNSNTVTMKMHKSTKSKVTWSTSDKSVATVKSSGKSSAKVTVKGQGSCTITAKVDGKTYTATVKAGQQKSATKKTITMNMIPTQELKVGDSFTLTASLQPSSLSTKDIKWKSSDPSIATVSQKGNVVLKKKGKVTITAYYTKNTNLTVSNTFNVLDKKIYISDLTLSVPKKGYVGGTVTYKATILPANASNKKLTWTSSNSKIATVDQKGLVSCKAAGQVRISVKTNDGTNATVTSGILTIEIPRAMELHVETSSIPEPLMVGDTFTVKASVKPDNARNKGVRFISSDTEVLTIDDNGNVTCLKDGDATIIIESEDPDAMNLYKEIPIHVNPKKTYIRSIEITGPDLAMEDTDIEYSVKSLSPSEHDDTITWTSSNTEIAQVTEGDNAGCKVHTNKIGSTIITATTSTGLKTQIKLEVVDKKYPANMDVKNIPTWKLYEDSVFTMTAVLRNLNKLAVIGSPVTWKSSDPNVASVDSKGNVTAHKAGQVTITVSSDLNKELTYSTTFTINPGVEAKELKITIPDDIKEKVVMPGDQFDLTAVVLPSNASNKNVIWTSSNEAVATVDSNGHFHALKNGTVDIQAILKDNSYITYTYRFYVGGIAAQDNN